MQNEEGGDDVHRLREENALLRAELARLRGAAQPLAQEKGKGEAAGSWVGGDNGRLGPKEIERFSRQMLLPAIGIEVQARLLKSSVLVVGAGGLGSPVALYLAGAGVGRLGIVDRDTVELSNLHRQIIHCEATVGVSKVASAAAACRSLSSSVTVVEHGELGLTQANALALVGAYDVVVDASDNAPTRYLINDACVISGKPLVSGAALGLEGQMTVYNHRDGPCYRCLFPEPAQPDGCQRCADAGVLGVVPGIIGTLQALEALKLAGGFGDVLYKRLLLLDAACTRVHTVKLRGRSPDCAACGHAATLTRATFPAFDYLAFTGQAAHDGAPAPLCILEGKDRLLPRDFAAQVAAGEGGLLLDVRAAHEFAIVAIPGAMNVPLAELPARVAEVAAAASVRGLREGGGAAICVVCRRGNDSQRAVEILKGGGIEGVVDLRGGLDGWREHVDPAFPRY